MKVRCWILIVVLACFAHLAAGDEYWPMPVDRVYHYANADGATLTVTWQNVADGEVESHCMYELGGAIYQITSDRFIRNARGDLCIRSYSYLTDGSLEPASASYVPAMIFLVLPPFVGDEWRCAGRVTQAGVSVLYYHTCSVVREETVTVPCGTFEALVVVQQDTFGPTLHTGTYYLNREIGPVLLPGGFKLVSIGGAVAAAEETWGSVKAQFR